MLTGHMTADQAAHHLGISRQTLYNLHGTADFPEVLHIGRTPMYPVAGLDAWRAIHPARAKTGSPPPT